MYGCMGLVIPELEGVPEMQSCPLYVGVVLPACGNERHEKRASTRARNSGTRDKSQGTWHAAAAHGETDVSRAITAVQPGLDSMTLVRCPQHRVALDDLETEFLQTLADWHPLKPKAPR
jgi:hypothetical protein